MTTPLFQLQSYKFSSDEIDTVFVYPQCDEVFKKEFPPDLEGQIKEFKCPVCDNSGEADLPYKAVEERELLCEDLVDVEQENIEDFDKAYL